MSRRPALCATATSKTPRSSQDQGLSRLHNHMLEPSKTLPVRKGPSPWLHNRKLESSKTLWVGKGLSWCHNPLLELSKTVFIGKRRSLLHNGMLGLSKMLRVGKELNPQMKSVLKGLGCKNVPGTIMNAFPADQGARKGLVSPGNTLLVQKMKHILLGSAQKRSSRGNAVYSGGEANS